MEALVRQSILILALLNKSVYLVTVRSNVPLLTEQLWEHVLFPLRNYLVTSLMFWPYCELVWRPQMPDAKNYPVFMLRHESLFGLWLACCGELTFFSKCEVVRCLGDLNIFVAITSYKYIIGKCYIVTLRFSSLLYHLSFMYQALKTFL